MVTAPEVKKVIIISDKEYANKANGRNGGVGTETQIISKEIYDNEKQDKFVAVVTEKDENGKPYLPVYYKARIYIDLSESDKYADNFEVLLRWIFDKPLHKKPPLGKLPAFLDDKNRIELGTSFAQKRLISAIKEKKEILDGAFNEYLNLFSENIEKFRIHKDENVEYDDIIFKTIEAFLPYKNEFLQVLLNLGQYGLNDNNISAIHRFFESTIPYLDRTENMSRYTDWDFDVFKFIIHELFLNVISVLLKFEKFNNTAFLLSQKYYVPSDMATGVVMNSFVVFRQHLKSFKYRNDRLSLRRLSLRADLLKLRTENSGLDFRYIMQADFVLYIYCQLNIKDTFGYGWWPETLLYIGRSYNALEIFARAQSKIYFDKMKCILNVESVEDIKALVKEFSDGKRELPRWDFESLNPSVLLGIEKLANEK